MTQREARLRRIAVGDLFHGRPRRGTASFICLALQVHEKTIFARRITTQSVHEFNRATGVEIDDRNPIIINSVATLPHDIREILLGLDRKYRESEYRYAEDPDWEMQAEDAKLTKDEVRALLAAGKMHDDNPI
jgi:CRISPR/Cas system CSM-associated protein Csm5 (group 7 of RAMP superfamily)